MVAAVTWEACVGYSFPLIKYWQPADSIVVMMSSTNYSLSVVNRIFDIQTHRHLCLSCPIHYQAFFGQLTLFYEQDQYSIGGEPAGQGMV